MQTASHLKLHFRSDIILWCFEDYNWDAKFIVESEFVIAYKAKHIYITTTTTTTTIAAAAGPSSYQRKKLRVDGQYTYDVTMWRVRVTTFAVESNNAYWFFFNIIS